MSEFLKAVGLWLRIAGANAVVTLVSKLLENLGVLNLPPQIEMYVGPALAALLAWLRSAFGDVLGVRASPARKAVAGFLRVVGAKL